MSIDLQDLSKHVREVTEEEVEFYRINGWVKLDGLLNAELVAAVRDAGDEFYKSNGHSPAEWLSLATAGVEPCRSLVFGTRMARNAQRLMDRGRLSGRDVEVRYRNDALASKGPGATRTAFHQDMCEHGSDRVGEMQFWVALEEVTPEMGAMRFLSKVHHEGPLGCVLRQTSDTSSTQLAPEEDLLDHYPRLTELYEFSQPFHYQPGDATVHHGHMIHGGPPNTTTATRRSYIFSYVPADSRWWNGRVHRWGTERTELSEEHNPLVPTK